MSRPAERSAWVWIAPSIRPTIDDHVRPESASDGVPRGSFRAQPGVRAHYELVEFRFGAWFLAQQSAGNRRQKTERHAQDADVLQWEPSLRSNQVVNSPGCVK